MADVADVLIVTATEVESLAVMEVFERVVEQKAEPRWHGRICFSLGVVNGARVFLTQSEMGSGGIGASLITVYQSIEALSPAAVIMVGIAFGINDQKQAIGDILVAQQLRLYDLQRVGTQDDQPQISLRGDKPHASSKLISLFKGAALQWQGARVRFGVVLTGDKLVDNVDFRDQLRDFELEAIGGEMEGAGLYVACQDKKVDWILVKAICDWADGNKAQDKDDRQQTAAQNAVAFVLHGLQFASMNWRQTQHKGLHYPPILSPYSLDAVAADGGVAGGAGSFVVGQEIRGSVRVTQYNAPVTQVTSSTKLSTSPYSSLPHQPYFFGREKELQTIAEAILPEARTWGALIDGPGGIGKTALAIRAGHLAPVENFPLKIFISAKVRELTPKGEQMLEDFMLPNYQELLVELARELGENTLAKTAPNGRANAVRRALANQHALLVIDNVETFPEPERMRLYQFLSRLPISCKAIVTSRRRDDLDARIIRLDRLEQKDALDLLAELAKNNRHLQRSTETERQKLYEITNGNPLLLRWVVGQLGREGSHCRTVDEACAFLKNAPKNNDPLEYIFGDLLDTFTASETAVLAALTYFTQPAKVEWVAELAELACPVALTALEDLTARALLVSSPDLQTFLLPSLAAEFLRRKYPEAITQTGNRLTNFAYVLAVQNGYRNYELFPVLEAQWPMLAAAIPHLVQGENDRLQRVCDAVFTFLDFSGRWDDGLALSEQAEAKAMAANDLWNAGMRAYWSGCVYYSRNQVPEVLACSERCAKHWEKFKHNVHPKVCTTHLRGLAHQLTKNYSAAQEAFQEILFLWQAITPDNDAVAFALNDLATLEKVQGNYVAADDYYRRALQIARRNNNDMDIALYTSNLAELALMREDWIGAETLAHEALPLAEQARQQELIGETCFYIAKALTRQGKPTEGIPYANRAVEIFTKLRQLDKLEEAQAVLQECEG